ncbi:MAG: hypothetical protein HY089_11285 [Ignavibacteriales bacterium]|nr:hypothetical protein [Ignavibacteriales bacterium]
MKLSYISLLGLLVWGIGCSEDGEGDIMVGFSGGEKALNVTNHSSRTIYYFAVDQSELPLIDWIPTTDPFAPHRIESGTVKKISFNEIYLFEPGDTIAFYYWSLDPKPHGGFAVSNFKHAILTPSYLVLNSSSFRIG